MASWIAGGRAAQDLAIGVTSLTPDARARRLPPVSRLLRRLSMLCRFAGAMGIELKEML